MNGEDRQQPGEIPGGGKEQEEEFPEKPAVDEDGGEEEPKAKGFIIYLAMMMSSDPYHSMATETGQGMGMWDRGKQRTMKSRVLCFCPVKKNLQLLLPNFASLPLSASFIFQKKIMLLLLSAFGFWLLALGFWLFLLRC